MYGSRYDLLADSAFAGDQNRGMRTRHTLHGVEQAEHGRAADDGGHPKKDAPLLPPYAVSVTPPLAE